MQHSLLVLDCTTSSTFFVHRAHLCILPAQQAGGEGRDMAGCFLPLLHPPQQPLHLCNKSETALRLSIALATPTVSTSKWEQAEN